MPVVIETEDPSDYAGIQLSTLNGWLRADNFHVRVADRYHSLIGKPH